MGDLRDRIYMGIGATLLTGVGIWMAFIGFEYLYRFLETIGA